MKDFSDILICSDFDGTLYHGKKQCVSDIDAEAIRYFQEHGGAFTLCSGRLPFVLEEKGVKNVSLNAPIISMNGALIYDLQKNEKLFEDIMHADILEYILKICESTDDVENLFIPAYDEIKESPLIPPSDKEKIRSVIEYGAFKTVFRLTPEKNSDANLELVKSVMPEKFAVSRSWAFGVEVQNATASKGLSARRVANMLGRKTLICVGDYENDISMIKEADIGYAVANACEPLKAVADRITTAKLGGAIAEIIYSL